MQPIRRRERLWTIAIVVAVLFVFLNARAAFLTAISTTVLAFIPMAFVTGMVGPYMGPIPFFVPTAIIVSLLLGVWSFALYRSYVHSLLFNPKRRRRTLAAIGSVLLSVMVLPAIGLVRFRMLPKADRQQFFLYIDLPEATPVEKTMRITDAFCEQMLADPRVRMAQSYVGRPPILDFNGLFRGTGSRQGSHQATVRVGLTPTESCTEKSELIVRDLRGRLEKTARAQAPDGSIKIKLVEDPPGPPVLSKLVLRVR